MDFNLTEDQQAFAETARQFAESELAPYAAKWDQEHIFPKDTIKAAGELGFCGLYTPEEAGGLGLSRLDSSIIFEQLAIPAAWSMAFVQTKRTKNLLMWMLSTKMLPPVGVLIPIYLLFRDFGLLDTRLGLVIVMTLINLPIMVWMLYTYFREIPHEILEAARMDGAGIKEEIFHVLLPIALPGIASTLLLNVILAWNEAFWTLILTAANAAPLTAFIASYSSPEGLFYAKLSAASVMAVVPILILGWFSQKQLVRGLSFGAVK